LPTSASNPVLLSFIPQLSKLGPFLFAQPVLVDIPIFKPLANISLPASLLIEMAEKRPATDDLDGSSGSNRRRVESVGLGISAPGSPSSPAVAPSTPARDSLVGRSETPGAVPSAGSPSFWLPAPTPSPPPADPHGLQRDHPVALPASKTSS